MLLLIMAVLAVSLLGATGATVVWADTPPAGDSIELAGTPSPPLVLPDSASTSGTAPATVSQCGGCRYWIVGGLTDERTRWIAVRHRARTVNARLGVYRIARGKAAKFAQDLRRAGRLAFAEPDVAVRSASYPEDRLVDEQKWLAKIVNPADATPPLVNPESPLIGLVEKGIDPTHPDLLKADLTGATPTGNVAFDSHGTSVAGIIGSPGEGAGIRGVLPGARMSHFPAGATCSTAAVAVTDAVQAGVSVVNMSYTMPRCYTHYLATQFAVSRDVLLVAAAGNTGHQGNAVQWPAADPHVLSVGAVDSMDLIADFSTRNRFVDLAAPGSGVLAPVFVAGEPGPDSIAVPTPTWAQVNGTSFSAPMVAAAAAWLRQVRPDLSALQISRVLAISADDLGKPGHDPLYGAGLLDIDAALIAPSPVGDPLEPNDTIALLKGQSLVPKTKYLWKPRGRRLVRITASVSRTKDPVDIYRIQIPARKKILITAAQLEGDVKITALKPTTKTLQKTRNKVIVKSDRAAPRTEGIAVRNLRRKPKSIWLAITQSRRDKSNYAAYRLAVRRTR